MKDYRVEVKVRNNYLLSAIEASEYKSVAHLSRETSVNKTTIYEWLALKKTPLTKQGKWRSGIERLSEALNCLPGDLFPPQHIDLPLEQNRASLDLDLNEVTGLLSADRTPEQELLLKESIDVLMERVKKLPPRAREALVLKWGLNGEDEHGLKATAKKMSLCKARVHQLECKAIHLLRKPSNKLLPPPA